LSPKQFWQEIKTIIDDEGTVNLRVYHDGNEKTVSLTLGEAQ
jgi:hypothetical protein